MLTPKTTGTRAASMTHDELRPYAVTFQGKHGFVPTYDQLVEFVAEQGMHVQCQFNGHGQRYTYRVQEGEPVSIGDYLQVWSPMTERNELVRVVGIGRGSWTGHTKTAHRVDITVVD